MTDQSPSSAAPPPGATNLAASRTVVCALEKQAALARLETLARRGKLPGFEQSKDGHHVFVVATDGTPFEGELRAVTSAQPDGGLAFTLTPRLKPRMVWIFAAVLVLTVWPGVVLTDKLLAMMFPTTSWLTDYTYHWYIPLSIISGIWAMVASIKKSQKLHLGAIDGVVARIQAELSK